MSLQSAQEFHTRVQADPTLQLELKPILAPKTDLVELAKIARRKGFDATPQELGEVIKSRLDSDDLTDFELEMVAAGSGTPSTAFA